MVREFENILNEFLIENHLSQTDFANAIGVKPSQGSEWLKEKAKPGYNTLKAIATVYRGTADYFLGISENY